MKLIPQKKGNFYFKTKIPFLESLDHKQIAIVAQSHNTFYVKTSINVSAYIFPNQHLFWMFTEMCHQFSIITTKLPFLHLYICR